MPATVHCSGPSIHTGLPSTPQPRNGISAGRHSGAANAWGPMTIDEDTAWSLIPTRLRQPRLLRRHPPRLQSFRRFAPGVDAKTGKLVWQQQLVHHVLSAPISPRNRYWATSRSGASPYRRSSRPPRRACCTCLIGPGPAAVPDHRKARTSQLRPRRAGRAHTTLLLHCLAGLSGRRSSRGRLGGHVLGSAQVHDLLSEQRNEGIFTPRILAAPRLAPAISAE